MVVVSTKLEAILVIVQEAIDSTMKLALVFFSNTEKIYHHSYLLHIDINECIEPNSDGTFPQRCNSSEMCNNTIGNYTCTCYPVFNTTGICTCMYILETMRYDFVL